MACGRFFTTKKMAGEKERERERRWLVNVLRGGVCEEGGREGKGKNRVSEWRRQGKDVRRGGGKRERER